MTAISIGEMPTHIDAHHGLCIDLETKDSELKKSGSGVRRKGSYIVGVALSSYDKDYDVQWSTYIPLRHQQGGNCDPAEVYAWLQARIDACTELMGTNLIYDVEYLIEQAKIDFEILTVGRRVYVDVQVAEPVIDENKRGEYSLDHLAVHYGLGGKVSDELYQYLADNFKGQPTRNAQAGRIYLAPSDIVAPYAISDVELPPAIYQQQRKIIHKQNLGEVWLLERDLFPMLVAMKLRGVRIDRQKAAEVENRMQHDVDKSRRSFDSAGVNPNSSISLGDYCDSAGIEYPRTPTGLPSFTTKFMKKHPNKFLRDVYEFRRLEKSTGTFIKNILKFSEDTGRIHCQFNQLKSDSNGTVSGRFSSSNPNLQNQPARDEELGPMVRSLYIPDDGEDWGGGDYSQIEYRLLVEEALQKLIKNTNKRDADGNLIPFPLEAQPKEYKAAVEMLNRFVKGIADGIKVDIHEEVGNMCGIARRDGKNINFGMVYGLGLAALMASLGYEKEICQEIIAKYHDGMPFAKKMYNFMQSWAKKGNVVVTIGNRQRRFFKVQLRVPWQWRGKEDPPEPFNLYMKEDDGEWTRDLKKRPPVFKSPEEAFDFYGANNITQADLEYGFCQTALNALLQGGAADIMKRAMLDIWNAGICVVLGAPLLTVHDELNWSIPRTKQARDAFDESIRIMEKVYIDRLQVPLVVDYATGANWSECK